MPKRNLLFMVHTEYHLLVALNIIREHFHDSGQWNVLIIAATEFSTRFDLDLEHIPFPHVSIRIYNGWHDSQPMPEALRANIEEILASRFERFFLFLEQYSLAIYLTIQLRRKGTIICNAQDGAKAYAWIGKKAIGWRVKHTAENYRNLFRNRLRLFTPVVSPLQFGELRFIDEVWVQYPQTFQNHFRRRVHSFQIAMEGSFLNEVLALFRVNLERDLGATEKVFYYVNQPFKNEAVQRFEWEVLDQLLQRHADKKVVVKLHPATSEADRAPYAKIPGVRLVDKPFPAELGIAGLRNSLAVSFFSTSGFVHNPSCRMYWLYPMLSSRNMTLNNTTIINPTDHIILADSIEQVV